MCSSERGDIAEVATDEIVAAATARSEPTIWSPRSAHKNACWKIYICDKNWNNSKREANAAHSMWGYDEIIQTREQRARSKPSGVKKTRVYRAYAFTFQCADVTRHSLLVAEVRAHTVSGPAPMTMSFSGIALNARGNVCDGRTTTGRRRWRRGGRSADHASAQQKRKRLAAACDNHTNHARWSGVGWRCSVAATNEQSRCELTPKSTSQFTSLRIIEPWLDCCWSHCDSACAWIWIRGGYNTA